MYLSFFRLKELPFNLTPDPRFLFMSRSHREAFEHLVFGIEQRRGFIEVTGGVGTGKTTLCRALLEELDRKVPVALIFNSYLSEMELLKAINDEFGIDSSGGTRKALIDVLNRFLIDQLAKGGNACLVLDECQNLQVPVLEQVRMLSNLETESEKLLQIVMMGQPEFHQLLKSDPLKPLDERIQVRSFLEPLSQEDTGAYIQHRLTVAGSKGDIIFKDGALRIIYEYSQGIPRRINTICDRCLLLAYSHDTYSVSTEYARQAMDEIQGGHQAPRPTPRLASRPKRWLARLGLVVPVALIALIGGGLLGHLLTPSPQKSTPAAALPGPPPVVEERAVPYATPVVRDEIDVPEAGDADLSRKDTELTEAEKPEKPEQAQQVSADRIFSALPRLAPPPAGSRVEDAARLVGMDARRISLSWNDLRRFQRPCLLEILTSDGFSPRYDVLRGISEDGVWVQERAAEGARWITRDELARSWFGGTWILFPFSGKDGKLKPGVRGNAVAQLKGQLAQLGYWNGQPSDLYNDEVRLAVMAFQRDLHLPVDGVAGPQTRGMIIQLLGDAGDAS
jgi:general secretion pathway protein A